VVWAWDNMLEAVKSQLPLSEVHKGQPVLNRPAVTTSIYISRNVTIGLSPPTNPATRLPAFANLLTIGHKVWGHSGRLGLGFGFSDAPIIGRQLVSADYQTFCP